MVVVPSAIGSNSRPMATTCRLSKSALEPANITYIDRLHPLELGKQVPGSKCIEAVSLQRGYKFALSDYTVFTVSEV